MPGPAWLDRYRPAPAATRRRYPAGAAEAPWKDAAYTWLTNDNCGCFCVFGGGDGTFKGAAYADRKWYAGGDSADTIHCEDACITGAATPPPPPPPVTFTLDMCGEVEPASMKFGYSNWNVDTSSGGNWWENPVDATFNAATSKWEVTVNAVDNMDYKWCVRQHRTFPCI